MSRIYREKQEMINIHSLFHLKTMIKQLRKMQQMSRSEREQWAIDETLPKFTNELHISYAASFLRGRRGEKESYQALFLSPSPSQTLPYPLSPLTGV